MWLNAAQQSNRQSMNTHPPSQWSVGQKAICIDDRFPMAILDWCDHVPIAGYIYTIRAIQAGLNPLTRYTNVGLLLVEIVNPLLPRGSEPGFCHTRFVPWLDTCSESERDGAAEPLQVISTEQT
jgi:hypothetical protein